VQDDGSGFDPERVRGLGLLGMEERARHLGGTFHVDSRPGRGTLLRVTLPLAALPDAINDSNKVATPAPRLDTAVVWNGGLADGADSHSAG
jgi:signal transduction histidine kinase